jgi:hypothetical protein
MSTAFQIIQLLVAPVIVISANGLLCLALYNRLAGIVGRSRTLNKERFDLSSQLPAVDQASLQTPEAKHLTRRMSTIDELGHRLFEHARLVRHALICLLATVQCMICSSLFLGLSVRWTSVEWVAVVFFVAGLGVMFLGILFAMRELGDVLDPLQYEHRQIEWAHQSAIDDATSPSDQAQPPE